MKARTENFIDSVHNGDIPVNRWWIRGTLTTLTELHVGDGCEAAIIDRSRLPKKEKDESDADTVMVDYDGRAMIPGSSIRGPFRALIEERLGMSPEWTALLGSNDTEVGGKVMFLNAQWKKGCLKETIREPENSDDLMKDHARPWWDDKRRTCIAVSHRRDSKTNTVKDQLLYHTEYVPAGEVFSFELVAANLSEKESAVLLEFLKAIETAGDKPPLHLGARESKDWGRLRWQIENAWHLDTLGIKKWLKADNPPAGKKICKSFGKNVWGEIEPLDLPGGNRIEFDLVLRMDAPWLVGDPRQGERGKAYGKWADDIQKQMKKNNTRVTKEQISDQVIRKFGEKPSDALAMVDEFGFPMSPAKSMAGLLRACADVIQNSLGLMLIDPSEALEGQNTSEKLVKLQERDPGTWLLGCSGWKGPLTNGRLIAFEESGAKMCGRREFNATDRYTGGGAEGMKYNADPAAAGKMKVSYAVDLDKLSKVGKSSTDVSVGLLALVLRDFAEGDLDAGRKKGIGIGACHALSKASVVRILKENHEDYWQGTLQEWFKHENTKKAVFEWDEWMNKKNTGGRS